MRVASCQLPRWPAKRRDPLRGQVAKLTTGNFNNLSLASIATSLAFFAADLPPAPWLCHVTPFRIVRA
jgi:hypothetical protein